MNFEEAENYLYSLGNEVETMKLGLDNIRILLAALGDPHTRYKKVQVAGTNGKGSVCAFLDSICVHAGIRTGLYTSPHLVSIRERIKIDGTDIGETEFAKYASRVRETAKSLVSGGGLEAMPTFFEQVTAIALLVFAEVCVELSVLETGLGGRFDATTAASAEIAAITQIDLDHQEYLGDTIEDIAAEKAAIIRTDSDAVIGEQSPDAMNVILERCSRVGVEAKLASQVRTACVSGRLSLRTNRGEYKVDQLGLNGKHQIENAKIALLLAEELQQYFSVTDKHIVHGLENAAHPGRLEYVGDVLLDGAHNVAGAEALAAYLDEFVDKPITMIFGAMRDKNVREIAEVLWPMAERLILTRPSNSRAMTAEKLLEFLPRDFNHESVVVTGSVEEALQVAGSGVVVLVTGSLYLAGQARKILTSRH